MTRTGAEVLAELAELAADIRNVDAMRARRDDLYREGLSLSPPLTQRAMAAASGVSEAFVGHAKRAKTGSSDRNGRRLDEPVKPMAQVKRARR